MKSILQISRLMLATNLVLQSAGLSHAIAGTTAPVLSPSSRAVIKHIDPAAQSRIKAGYANLPLYFEANSGQADAAVKFLGRGPGYNLFFAGSGATVVLNPGAKTAALSRHVLRIGLKGANAQPVVSGIDLLPGKSNYFIGKDPRNWHTQVAQYSKVGYSQVYPGIDMIYAGDPRQLEYSFVIKPGANPDQIRMNFAGAQGVTLDQQGNLLLTFQGGDQLSFKAPTLYQDVAGERLSVDGHFILIGKHHVGFKVGHYVPTQTLVIDPSMAYSSYLGGTVDDRAFAIDVDASGNAYVTGATASNLFPGAAGKFQAANGGGASDVFVTKINAAGTAVLWSTYLGGGGNDQGNAIAVDGLGNVYVTGNTTGVGFPTAAPFQAANGGGTDAFVTALNPAGTALIYSTYLGDAGTENGNAIAVDAAGIAYVAGLTTSAAFPVSAGVFQNTIGGANDAFIASFSAAGTRRYASFLGGTGSDQANAIAIDSLGDAYVSGQAADAFPIFPLAPPSAAAFKTTITGAFDAFIAKVSPSGANLLYSTYVGGSGIDDSAGIALDSSNNVYITGFTFSADFPKIGFATIGQTTIGTAPDAYVFKLKIGNGGGSNDGVYSTYLGASTDDRGMAIAVDAQGDAYVSGRTTSGDFPTVSPLPGQSVLGATGKAFITEIGPTGGTKVFSTYLGGVTDQAAQGIALDPSNNIYVTGWTNSTNFDTTIPFQAANAGAFDAFVSKIGAPTPSLTAPSAGGAGSYIFPSPADGATATIAYTMAEAGNAEIRIYNEIGDIVTKVTESKLAGVQSSTIRTAWLAPGVYFYILNLNYNSGNSDKRKLKKFVVKH